jgi:uncharacterized membrane protein HdeD (DUF308 family)
LDLPLVFVIVIGIISVLFGLLIIAKPKILAYLVGGYFIVTGVLWIIRALV